MGDKNQAQVMKKKGESFTILTSKMEDEVELESTNHRGGDAGRIGYWFGLSLTGLRPASAWPLTILVGTTLV
ncbi:hypothetical protein L6452_44373 [Arctium lappa]|uniref:Uncharacterized protein n=1 Tax=Arctium lappa TaxID=4217 RepID=A0ACB8XFG3_ARCLA|nr:hypothetical protein L6452_44373 [Arctium lappa]